MFNNNYSRVTRGLLRFERSVTARRILPGQDAGQRHGRHDDWHNEQPSSAQCRELYRLEDCIVRVLCPALLRSQNNRLISITLIMLLCTILRKFVL